MAGASTDLHESADTRVQLYLEESLAFRAHSPEAAVALAHQT